MDLGVSYIAAHLPEHLEMDMRELRDIGCNEVLFALQENHIVYLQGALKYGAGIAKEHGLKPYVVVWGYANTFGGGRISTIMLEDTEMWRVSADGRKTAFGCLNNPKLIDKFIEITDVCRANGYEGIFVDEPTPQECFCEHCRQLFYASYGKELTADAEEYNAFRNDTVRRYTDGLCKRVKALDPSQTTMACVMPCDRECFEAVAAIPELDIFGTDPYWLLSNGGMSIEQACDYARQTRDICVEQNKISQVWLNGWAIKEGLEEQIYTGGKALAAVGCDSFYTWSFRGAMGTNEECARPDVAWSSVSRLYRELAGK
ncbi:MAG: hypothetical protein Q7T82_10230 [Armatimonadota bacterium]|nr:hypothetical protein [Armatimonadota bacterium]